MSDRAPEGYYMYQPDAPRADGRIYAVGGFESIRATCKGLTREEAQVIADALNASKRGEDK